MIRTTLMYVFVAAYVILVAPVALLWSLLTGGPAILYSAARFCLMLAGLLSGIRIRLRGMERIDASQSYLFLSNHAGNIDGPVLFYAIPRDVRALIKKEMMRLPLLSLVLKRANFVPIDRADPAKARGSIDRLAGLLGEGFSFIAFPEGTRSRDGRLGPFKKGVFVAALKSGVPVMPVTILNTGTIQPRGSYSIRKGRVELVFHESIPTAGMTLDDRDRLIELTRAAISSALPAGVPAQVSPALR